MKLPETNSVILPRTMEQAEYIEEFAMRDYDDKIDEDTTVTQRSTEEEEDKTEM